MNYLVSDQHVDSLSQKTFDDSSKAKNVIKVLNVANRQNRDLYCDEIEDKLIFDHENTLKSPKIVFPSRPYSSNINSPNFKYKSNWK